MASADEDDLLRCFEKAFQGFDDKISPSSPECQQDNDASPESLCSTKCSSGHASVSKRELTPPILPVTSLRTGDMYTSQLGYGMGYQVPSPIKDAQDQEKAFEDSYFGHYNAASMQLFVPDLCDEALSSAPSTSEPSFGGISRRNSSEEPTSPATSDYQLPSRSQCIFTPSPNINNTNSNTSDIQTLDSTFMPALMPVPVSVLPSPSQPTIQRMQPNTFMPFMSSMSTMSTMPPMPNMQTMTYNGTTPLTSALDSPPTDFIDTLFSSCPLEHPAPVPLFTQNCEDMLFDLDDFTVWNANLVPTLAPQLPPQSPEELYAIPTQERVTAQLETYFRRPDQQRLRRTLESIQGASWLVAHQKEPNDSTTKQSVYLAFLSNKGDGKASNGSSGNDYRCLFDGCNKSFDRQDRAIGHIRMHFEHRPFQCNTQCGVVDCPERFYCTSYLKSHIKRQKVPCESCGVSFFRNAIKRHKVNCSGRQALWPWFETQNHNTQEVDRNLKRF